MKILARFDLKFEISDVNLLVNFEGKTFLPYSKALEILLSSLSRRAVLIVSLSLTSGCCCFRVFL